MLLELPRKHLAQRAPGNSDIIEVSVLTPEAGLQPMNQCESAGVAEPQIALRQEVIERALRLCGLRRVERSHLPLSLALRDPSNLEISGLLDIRLSGAARRNVRPLRRSLQR